MPAWAQGVDLWKDFTAPRGTLADPTDTHASTIYAPNAAGVYLPFAANVLTRTDLGLQTVPTRTQMYDADPSDATLNAGNRAGHTITSNATTDAFGGNDGDKVDLIAGGSYCYWRVNTAAAAVARSGFLILRADAPVTLRLRMADDLGTDTTVTSINVTTSWQRFDIADLSHTASSFTEIGIDARSGVAGGDNLAKSFYISHRQMEAAAFSSAPIRTASAAVNGNQQVITPTQSYALGAATEVTVNVLALNDGDWIWQDNDGSVSNRAGIRQNAGQFQFIVDSGGANQAAMNLGAVSTGVKSFAAVYGANYAMAQLVGGTPPSADTLVTLPVSQTKFNLGGNGYNATNNGYSRLTKVGKTFQAADAASFTASLARATAQSVAP